MLVEGGGERLFHCCWQTLGTLDVWGSPVLPGAKHPQHSTLKEKGKDLGVQPEMALGISWSSEHNSHFQGCSQVQGQALLMFF